MRRYARLVLLVSAVATPSLADGQPSPFAWQMSTGQVAFALSAERAAEVNTSSWSVGLRLGYERAVGGALESGAADTARKASVRLSVDLGRAADRTSGTHTTTPDVIDFDSKMLTVGGRRGGTFVALTFLSDHNWSPGVAGLGYGYQYRGGGGLNLEGGLQATKDVASSARPRVGYRLGSTYQLGLTSRMRLNAEARAQGAFGTTTEDQRFLDASVFYSLAGNIGVTARYRIEKALEHERPRTLTQVLLAYSLMAQ
jgi:hypothetical protein